jgi:DNA-binding transcriptional LysR family regulator
MPALQQDLEFDNQVLLRVKGQLQTVTVRRRIHANKSLALTQAAAKGMGITWQPDFIAKPFLAAGEVVEIWQDFA